MANPRKEIAEAIDHLWEYGHVILELEARRLKAVEAGEVPDPDKLPHPSRDYHRWYSRALPLVKQLLPERYEEFQELYGTKKRNNLTASGYAISDYLLGFQVRRGGFSEPAFDTAAVFVSKFSNQLAILESGRDRLDSILADIEGVLQATLFSAELGAARELLKKGHLRAAGAVAGVVLESHLSKTCDAHGIKFRKKAPAISDYNDALKKADVIKQPMWRLIQRLADIRNLCVHAKSDEPQRSEVRDLIEGTAKVSTEVF